MAQNIMLRPVGAFKCAPILTKLWGFGVSQTPFATFDALTHPSGIGTIGPSDKTIAVRIYYQGRNLVMFFNMWTGTHNGQSVTPGLRGLFNLGRDEGSLADFDPNASGPPLFEVLSYNLDPAARWYGDFSHGQLNCQNGVDDPVAIQINRTLTPGRWRKRGTNATPSTPTLTMIEPQSTLNTQAKRTITGRSGGVNLVFEASKDNFIGERGNNKIRVKVSYGGPYSSGDITSTLSGDGTVASPYIYTIFTTASNSSNSAIIGHVNGDSKVKPILTAMGSNTTADTFDDDANGNPIGIALSGGLGVGDSEGLTSAYYDVYARYWDGGHKLLGYEGPSSTVSNDVVISSTTFKDLLIQVDVDESAESGRFSNANSGIRIYMRNGLETEAVWNLMNEDDPLPNTHREQKVIGTASNELAMWEKKSQDTLSYIGRTNILTGTSPKNNNDALIIYSGIPGLAALTRAFIINTSGNTFQLSATQGGSALDIGNTYSATADDVTDVLQVTGNITNGSVFQVGVNSLGIPASTNLFVVNATTSLGITSFNFSLSSGGSAIDISTAGSITIHQNGSGIVADIGIVKENRLWSIDQASSNLSATTNPSTNIVTLASQVTNGKVFVLQQGSVGIPLNTKLFAVNCQQNSPSLGSTEFQLSLTQGGTAIDITPPSSSIQLRMLASNQWSSSDQVIMPSGSGATSPSSLSLDTRYWIKSIDDDGFGVQLSSSRLGSSLPLGSSNGSSLSLKVVAVSMVIGSTTEPGRGMSPNQNRPPPHRYMCMSGKFNWCAGFDGYESKILSSKDQQFDELSPEGVDLEDEDFVKKSRSSSAFRITGLWSDMRSLHVHCEDGIVIINPSDTADQQEPLIDAGMVNGHCHSISDGNQIVFLAFNRQIMSFNGARYGNRASKAKTDDALAYINNYINSGSITSKPAECCLLHDKESSMIWFWMPSDTGSVGFGYDEALDGIVGPFTAPMNITGACSLESAIGCHILATKDGYLFAMDAINQYDHQDVITSTAPALNLTTDPLPTGHAGYDYQDITAIVSGSTVTRRLFYSQKSILETGLIDLGSPSTMKRFNGVEWRSISGSRGHVKVTAIDHAGKERGIWYGELGGKARNRPHAVRFNIVDTAIKLRFEIYSAERKPWLVRDLALLVS